MPRKWFFIIYIGKLDYLKNKISFKRKAKCGYGSNQVNIFKFMDFKFVVLFLRQKKTTKKYKNMNTKVIFIA